MNQDDVPEAHQWGVMTPEETAEYMAAHPAFAERVKAHARELLARLRAEGRSP